MLKKSVFSLAISSLLVACGGGGSDAGDGGFQQAKRPNIQVQVIPSTIEPIPGSLLTSDDDGKSGFYDGSFSRYAAWALIRVEQGNLPLETGDQEVYATVLPVDKKEYVTASIMCFNADDDNCVKKAGSKEDNNLRVVRYGYSGISVNLNAGDSRIAIVAAKPGKVRIRLSATGRDGVTNAVKEFDVDVKYPTTGTPFEVVLNAESSIPAFVATPMAVGVLDAAGNPVLKPADANNIIVTATNLPAGAVLAGAGQEGASLRLKTDSTGVAYFTTNPRGEGFLRLVAQADRADNNIDNGIQDLVTTTYTIEVARKKDGESTVEANTIITLSDLPPASLNQAYPEFRIPTAGGSPVEFSITAGNFPPGMTLSPAGLVSGTPTLAGSYKFTVTVLGVNKEKTSRELTLTVDSATLSLNVPTITISVNKEDCTYVSYPIAVESSSNGPFFWSLDGYDRKTAILSNVCTDIRTANNMLIPGLCLTVSDNSKSALIHGVMCPSKTDAQYAGSHALIISVGDKEKNPSFYYETVTPLIIAFDKDADSNGSSIQGDKLCGKNNEKIQFSPARPYFTVGCTFVDKDGTEGSATQLPGPSADPAYTLNVLLDDKFPLVAKFTKLEAAVVQDRKGLSVKIQEGTDKKKTLVIQIEGADAKSKQENYEKLKNNSTSIIIYDGDDKSGGKSGGYILDLRG